jgi:hypothetical protein
MGIPPLAGNLPALAAPKKNLFISAGQEYDAACLYSWTELAGMV